MVELKQKHIFISILLKSLVSSITLCTFLDCLAKEGDPPPPVSNPDLFKIILPQKSDVLSQGKKELGVWQEKEEYRRNWNTNPLGKFDTPSRGEKKRYVQDRYLKHLNREVQKLLNRNKGYKRFEKSLKGEKKIIGKKKVTTSPTSKKSSSKSRNSKVAQNIKEQKEFEFYITLRHKLNLFKGDGHLKIQSPFFDHETNLNQYREVTHRFKKDFNLFSFRGSFNYEWKNRVWDLQFQRSLFSKNIQARFKSSQNDKSMAFSNSSVIEGGLYFNQGF